MAASKARLRQLVRDLRDALETKTVERTTTYLRKGDVVWAHGDGNSVAGRCLELLQALDAEEQ